MIYRIYAKYLLYITIGIDTYRKYVMNYIQYERYTITVTRKMAERLKQEKERRYLESIPETIRMILSEYLSKFENVE